MPINSPQMLAPVSLAMLQQKELLAAEQPELEAIRAHAGEVVRECSVNSCDKTIGRYEKIFDLPAGGRTLEERRAAIIFYMNARLLITKEYLAQLLSEVLLCNCSILEQFSEYRFTVNIEGEDRSPNLPEAARYVRLLKPAHLEANLRYRQRQRGKIVAAVRAGIGLHVQIHPYQPEDISSTGDILTIAHIKSGYRMQIHPKGDE